MIASVAKDRACRRVARIKNFESEIPLFRERRDPVAGNCKKNSKLFWSVGGMYVWLYSGVTTKRSASNARAVVDEARVGGQRPIIRAAGQFLDDGLRMTQFLVERGAGRSNFGKV